MILIVTPSSRVDDCVVAIQDAVSEEVTVVRSLRAAAALLRTESCLAVVLDQHLMEAEPDETSMVMEHLGTAIPVQVNFAISGLQRVVREVRAAVQRRKREETTARRAAMNTLHCELNGTVTALLLSCEMALGSPGLSSEAAEKLQCAHGLVKKLCSQLQTAATAD